MEQITITQVKPLDVKGFYNRTVWVDGMSNENPPLNASNLNNIELAMDKVVGKNNSNNLIQNIANTLNNEIESRVNDSKAIAKQIINLSDETDKQFNTVTESTDNLDKKIDNASTSLDGKINTTKEELTNTINGVSEEVNTVEKRVSTVENVVTEHTTTLSNIQTTHTNDVKSLTTKIDTVDKRVDTVNSTVSGHTTDIESIKQNKVESGSVKTSSSANSVTRDGTKLNINVNAYSRSEVDIALKEKASSSSVTSLANRVTALEETVNTPVVSGGPGFYTASHMYDNSVHSFSVINTIPDTAILIPAVVKFTASFIEGDPIRFLATTESGSSIELTGAVKLMDGLPAVDGSFVEDTANIVIFSISDSSVTMFINSGVSTWAT